jgi:hypothetical protein
MVEGTPTDDKFLEIVQSADDWAGLACYRGFTQAPEVFLVYAWMDLEEG